MSIVKGLITFTGRPLLRRRIRLRLPERLTQLVVRKVLLTAGWIRIAIEPLPILV
jgi:hypothetical protein